MSSRRPSAEQLRSEFPQLFGATSIAALEPAVGVLEVREVAAGTTILQRDVTASALFLVSAGHLAASITEAGKKLELSEVGPGDWVGDVCFIDRGTSTADVIATEPSVLFVLTADAFDTLCLDNPRAARTILHGICARLSARVRRSAGLLHDQGVTGSWRSAPLDEVVPSSTGSFFERIRHALYRN
jgi:CRP/FNR family transcriptional regulator, cyclic AMP receptor protein